MIGRPKLSKDEEANRLSVRMTIRMPEHVDIFLREKSIRCGMALSKFLRFVFVAVKNGEVKSIEDLDLTKRK